MNTNGVRGNGDGVDPAVVGAIVAAVVLMVLVPSTVVFVCRKRGAARATPAGAEVVHDHLASNSARDVYTAIENQSQSNYATSLGIKREAASYSTLTTVEVRVTSSQTIPQTH